jgi:tetratricopeptide (TPR) repeat protein
MVFGQHGDSEKSIALSDESYEISVAIDNLWGQSYSRMFAGILYWQLGRPDKAIEMMEQCVRLGAEAGFLPSQLYVASVLALTYAYLGDFDRALPLAQKTLALATETMTYYQPSSLAYLGSVQLISGNNQDAEATYDEILSIRTYLEPLLDAALEEFKCLFLINKGDHKNAVRSGLNLVSLLQEIDTRVYLPSGLLLQGQAYLESGELDQAGDILAMARSEAEDLGFKWPLWQILATMARLETARGNPAEAQTLQDKAQAIFEEIAEHTPTQEMRVSLTNHPYWTKHYLLG